MKNDEYQFPKDEYLEQSDSNPSEKQEGGEEETTQLKDAGDRRMAFLRNRKFVIGLVVFVVIVVGLKLMHHHPKTSVPVVSEPTVQEQQAAPTVNPASFALPAQTVDTASATTISDMQSHLSEVHDQLNSVTAANAQLTQSVSALTAQVATLTAAVQETTQKLAAITAKPMMGMKKSAYHPMPVIYVLKALVPGRAWLIGSNGISINVAVGNYVSPYYGSIRTIDAMNGQVVTTSGKVITYGSNDS